MQNDSDFHLLPEAFEVEDSLNRLIECATSLHYVIMTNRIVGIDRNTNHAIGMANISEASGKFFIFESPSVTEHIERRIWKLKFRMFNEVDQPVTVQGWLTARESKALSILRYKADQIESPL